jgi:predicted dehydrogenase
MNKINRRSFLKTSAAASALAVNFVPSRVFGANDRVRIGVAGINGRGQSHMGAYLGMKNVEIAYLIDPDSRLFESRSRTIEGKQGKRPKCVQDVREALEDKNLDAVSVATCNHWHSLIGIWACQAGKDAYIEKPISHNIYEGRKLVEAAEKYNRIVQHGTQQRSSGGRAREIAAVHSGKYGKLQVSKGYCCKPRWSIGNKTTGTPPKGLDYNLWLGPAAEQAYHGNLVHYNWHWFWETGNGDTGNQGVHEMDVARWAIKGATMPKSVWSIGGRFGYEDQGETPNTQMAVYEYDEALLIFETRGLVGKHNIPRVVKNEYYTTEGKITGGKFYPKNGGKAVGLDNLGGEVQPGGPFGNFIDCVRSRKRDHLNADVAEGHYSSALCHLGNISYRTGEKEAFDLKSRKFHKNPQVSEGFEALNDNLKGIGLKLGDTTYQIGKQLEFDPIGERFKNEGANALLSRPYRKPFVVPENV